MALQTEIQVSIGGEVIPFINSFSLKEDIGEHSSFKIAVRGDILETELNGTSLLENSKNFLGQDCIIQVDDHGRDLGYTSLQFKGIVTHINSEKGKDGAGVGDIINIHGMSSSIIIDDGPHMSSALDTPLSEAIQNVLGIYDQSKLNINITPENDDTLMYSVQNQESGFQYMQRLAATRGEYLLYARDTLYFGKPDLGDDVVLNYGYDLTDFSLGLQPESGKFKYYTHKYLSDEAVEASTASVSSQGQGHTVFASSVSENMFQNETQIPFYAYEDEQLQQRLDTAITLQKKIIEQKQVSITGKSSNTSVSLGKVIDIQNESGTFGRYRITKVDHTCDENGNYVNSFTAISMDIDVYPLTDISTLSKSEIQIARVIDTNDPEGMSRIKVQYNWQIPMGGETPWLRMSTPYAGAEKGLHFIPETGEEVIIGYEGGNAERPFVMGALYNGSNKADAWQTETNDIKAIRSRSGHTVELNDTDGEETIKIYDNEGSIITFNTQEKSLVINATETIDIAAKNINIQAEENINIGAQQNVDIAAEADLSALAEGNVAIQSTGDTGVKSNGAIALEAMSDATVKGQKAIVEGLTTAEVNGTQTKVTGTAMTEVSAPIVKLN